MLKYSSLITATLLLSAQGAMAQDSATETTKHLDKIVVEAEGTASGPAAERASRSAGDRESIIADQSTVGSKTGTPILDVPASVSVVTEKEMKQRGVENLDEALAYSSGVVSDLYGSDNRYDHYLVRGFYQTSLGSYRDALPMRIPGFIGNRLEPYGLERVEILKGSTSSLFGLNSPGGLVNAVSKKPLDFTFGEVYSTFGDEHVEFGTDFGGPVDSQDKFFYRLTMKGQDSSDGTDFSDDDRVYFAPSLTWRPNDSTELTLLTDFNKRNGNPGHGIPFGSTIDPDTFLGEPEFDNMDTEEWNAGYQFSHSFGNGLQFRQNFRFTDLSLNYETVYGASTDATASRYSYAVKGGTQRVALDNQLQYDTRISAVDSRTLVGVDYYYEEVDEKRAFGSATGIDINNPVYCGLTCITQPPAYEWLTDRTAVGAYLQEEMTFYDRVILTLGGRYDHVETESEYPGFGLSYSSSDNSLTGRAGVTVKVRDDLSVYANYSESFEPVSAETALQSTPEPKEGTQYEIGVKYSPDFVDNALFTVALFDLTQTNVPYNTSPTTQEQVGEVNVTGIEFEGKMALTDQLDAILSYSYWDPTIEEDGTDGNAGNRPQLVPNNIGAAWLNYKIPGRGTIGDLTIGGGVRYIGESFADNANTIKLDARTVMDAAISYQFIENATLQLNASNIFDERSVTQVDTFANTAYYSDGRTVRLTLRYTW
jgi:iron complex outermembrane recepter protein